MGTLFAADFLNPDEAFRLKAELKSDRTVELHWDIAQRYKLYRDKVTIAVESGNAEVRIPLLPKGITYTDPSSGEKIDSYHDKLDVVVPVVKGDKEFLLSVGYQGCSEDGLCYPPITKRFKVDPLHPGALVTADEAAENSAGKGSVVAGDVPSPPVPSSQVKGAAPDNDLSLACLLYTSPSPRDGLLSRMPSSA